MRRSYAFRLAAAFAVVGAAAAVLTALAVNLAVSGLLNGYFQQRQAAQQQEVISALTASYRAHGGWDRTDLDGVGGSVAMSGGTLSVEDSSGRVVWQSDASRMGGMQGMMGSGGTMGSGGMMGQAALGPEQRLPVTVSGDRVGTAILRLPQAGLAAPDRSFRDAVNRALLLTGVVVGALAVLIGVLLARRATVPVRRLTAAAEAWGRGERDRRVRYSAGDEFGAMAASFDRMADSLEDQERLRRAFAGDVAHELRTPLMILRGQVEAMQDGVMDRDDAGLASMHEEVDRLGRMVADLEVLASADAARFTLRTAPVDLADLAAGVVAEFRPLFPDRGLRLEAPAGPVMVDGDGTRLRQVLGNLLSNALRFTPEGGSVEVRLSVAGPSAVLQVSDSGPGIPADELPRVFDRFFRGRQAGGAGSGIGLAVVSELVRAHGGSATAGNLPGGGAVLTVTLPLASAAPGAPGVTMAGIGRSR
ncbi:MAG TPA: ATP-binding protein [Candidatus Eisenbacteria bacterium]|nr:ATP-binding protein [Candidatus Eisenbacteria bacterium]